MSEVRVRMAPSPTGNLHLGTAYTTLFNYLYARKNKGEFILRLEDTDVARSNPEFEENILEGLQWLGLKWDKGPIKQTERLENYKKAAEKLVEEGKAYYCYCTPEELEAERKAQTEANQPQIYSGKCRNLTDKKEGQSVIRFKMPEDRGMITFNDMLHGEISFDSKLLGDMVIMRSNGMPLYNFAVVVDDVDMQISHVLRGDDHLSNTPKQIVLFEALGAQVPEFAHWPMVLNPDRIGKLSKRQGATSVGDFRKDGYLPEALVNYFALLGWTMPGDREIMSLPEMEELFDIHRMRLSGAAFDINKLDWLNGEYIRQMDDKELEKRLEEYLVEHPSVRKLKELVPLIKTRIKKLSDFVLLTDFIFHDPEYDMTVFDKVKLEDTEGVLEKIAQTMEEMSQPWQAESFEQTFRKTADDLGISASDIFQLLRVAVSGQLVTPPLFESIQIMGEHEAIKRAKHVAKEYPNFPRAEYPLPES